MPIDLIYPTSLNYFTDVVYKMREVQEVVLKNLKKSSVATKQAYNNSKARENTEKVGDRASIEETGQEKSLLHELEIGEETGESVIWSISIITDPNGFVDLNFTNPRSLQPYKRRNVFERQVNSKNSFRKENMKCAMECNLMDNCIGFIVDDYGNCIKSTSNLAGSGAKMMYKVKTQEDSNSKIKGQSTQNSDSSLNPKTSDITPITVSSNSNQDSISTIAVNQMSSSSKIKEESDVNTEHRTQSMSLKTSKNGREYISENAVTVSDLNAPTEQEKTVITKKSDDTSEITKISMISTTEKSSSMTGKPRDPFTGTENLEGQSLSEIKSSTLRATSTIKLLDHSINPSSKHLKPESVSKSSSNSIQLTVVSSKTPTTEHNEENNSKTTLTSSISLTGSETDITVSKQVPTSSEIGMSVTSTASEDPKDSHKSKPNFISTTNNPEIISTSKPAGYSSTLSLTTAVDETDTSESLKTSENKAIGTSAASNEQISSKPTIITTKDSEVTPSAEKISDYLSTTILTVSKAGISTFESVPTSSSTNIHGTSTAFSEPNYSANTNPTTVPTSNIQRTTSPTKTTEISSTVPLSVSTSSTKTTATSDTLPSSLNKAVTSTIITSDAMQYSTSKSISKTSNSVTSLYSSNDAKYSSTEGAKDIISTPTEKKSITSESSTAQDTTFSAPITSESSTAQETTFSAPITSVSSESSTVQETTYLAPITSVTSESSTTQATTFSAPITSVTSESSTVQETTFSAPINSGEYSKLNQFVMMTSTLSIFQDIIL
ncbi:hypothetical protein GQR58_009387 [Nymphon striatum]|nr:hypothetical protein GQR58_009387 [Nymphon striatum]